MRQDLTVASATDQPMFAIKRLNRSIKLAIVFKLLLIYTHLIKSSSIGDSLLTIRLASNDYKNNNLGSKSSIVLHSSDRFGRADDGLFFTKQSRASDEIATDASETSELIGAIPIERRDDFDMDGSLEYIEDRLSEQLAETKNNFQPSDSESKTSSSAVPLVQLPKRREIRSINFKSLGNERIEQSSHDSKDSSPAVAHESPVSKPTETTTTGQQQSDISGADSVWPTPTGEPFADQLAASTFGKRSESKKFKQRPENAAKSVPDEKLPISQDDSLGSMYPSGESTGPSKKHEVFKDENNENDDEVREKSHSEDDSSENKASDKKVEKNDEEIKSTDNEEYPEQELKSNERKKLKKVYVHEEVEITDRREKPKEVVLKKEEKHHHHHHHHHHHGGLNKLEKEKPVAAPLHLEIHIKGKGKVKAKGGTSKGNKGKEKIKIKEGDEIYVKLNQGIVEASQQHELNSWNDADKSNTGSVEDEKSLINQDEDKISSLSGEDGLDKYNNKKSSKTNASSSNKQASEQNASVDEANRNEEKPQMESEEKAEQQTDRASETAKSLNNENDSSDVINTSQVPNHFFEVHHENAGNQGAEAQEGKNAEGESQKDTEASQTSAGQEAGDSSAVGGGEGGDGNNNKAEEANEEETKKLVEKSSNGHKSKNEKKQKQKQKHEKHETGNEQSKHISTENKKKKQKKVEKVVEKVVVKKEEKKKVEEVVVKAEKQEELKQEQPVVKEEPKIDKQKHEKKHKEKHAHIELHQHKHFEHHQHINLNQPEEGGEEHQQSHEELGHIEGINQMNGDAHYQPHIQMDEPIMQHHHHHPIEPEHHHPIKEQWIVPTLHEKVPNKEHPHGAFVIEDHSLMDKHNYEHGHGVDIQEEHINHPHGLGLTPSAAFNLMGAYSSQSTRHLNSKDERENNNNSHENTSQTFKANEKDKVKKSIKNKKND